MFRSDYKLLNSYVCKKNGNMIFYLWLLFKCMFFVVRWLIYGYIEFR